MLFLKVHPTGLKKLLNVSRFVVRPVNHRSISCLLKGNKLVVVSISSNWTNYTSMRTLFRKYEFGHTIKKNPFDPDKTPYHRLFVSFLLMFMGLDLIFDWSVIFDRFTPNFIKEPWKNYILNPWKKLTNEPIYPYDPRASELVPKED